MLATACPLLYLYVCARLALTGWDSHNAAFVEYEKWHFDGVEWHLVNVEWHFSGAEWHFCGAVYAVVGLRVESCLPERNIRAWRSHCVSLMQPCFFLVGDSCHERLFCTCRGATPTHALCNAAMCDIRIATKSILMCVNNLY